MIPWSTQYRRRTGFLVLRVVLDPRDPELNLGSFVDPLKDVGFRRVGGSRARPRRQQLGIPMDRGVGDWNNLRGWTSLVGTFTGRIDSREET